MKRREIYVIATEENRNYMEELMSQGNDSWICIRDVYHLLEDPSIKLDKYSFSDEDYYRIRTYIKKRQIA